MSRQGLIQQMVTILCVIFLSAGRDIIATTFLYPQTIRNSDMMIKIGDFDDSIVMGFGIFSNMYITGES